MPLDTYQRVTNAILQQIETADPGSWTCPWYSAGSGLPRNAITGRTYRGINIVSLWCGAQASGYADDRWATYKQWAGLGAQVRRGEQGTLVVFYKDLRCGNGDAASNDPDEASEKDRRFVARASFVFNAAQVEGAPELPVATGEADPTPDFDSFVAATGAIVRTGGERACYVPAADEIRMPPRGSFLTTHGYTATLAHELIHYAVIWIMPHGQVGQLGWRGRPCDGSA